MFAKAVNHVCVWIQAAGKGKEQVYKMKQCIICGNTDDDNSTVCSKCGNPYVIRTEKASGAQEGPQAEKAAEEPGRDPGVQPEVLQEQAPEGAQAGSEAGSGGAGQGRVPAGRGPADAVRAERNGRPPRRTKSGPQIYGQEEMDQRQDELYAQQGTMRRTVPPRSAAQAPEEARRQMSGGQGRPSDEARQGTRRPAGDSGRPAGDPGRMAGDQSRPAGDPARGAGQARGGARRPAGRGRAAGQGRPMGQNPQARRIMETSRKALRSPLFILVALFNTLYVGSSIAAIVLKELNYSQFTRLLGDVSLPQQASGYMNTATSLLQKLDSGSMPAVSVGLCIPGLVFCLGLWIIVISAMTARERMSGAGFVLTRIVIALRLIVTSVSMLAVLVVSVAITVSAWVSHEKGMIIMAAVMLVVVIAVILMVVMYYFCYLATLKTCRLNSNTGESYGRLSAYVAVLHILLALTGIVSLLSGIVNMEITGITSAIGQMGWMILFGVWIFWYRKKMSRIGE